MWWRASLAILVACTAQTSLSVQRSVQLGGTVEEEANVEAPAVKPPPAEPGEPAPATPSPATPPAPPAKPEYLAAGLLEGDVALDEGWQRWRAGTAKTFDAIFEIAVLANRARPLETSDELMVIALADAVELSDCEPDRLGKIRLMAIMVRGAVHPPGLDAELARLADIGPVECAKLR